MKEDIGCNGVSLHKLELGDSLSVGFPGNNISIQTAVLLWQLLLMEFGIAVLPWQLLIMEFGIAVLPWQLFIMEFGICRFTWYLVITCSGPIVSRTE